MRLLLLIALTILFCSCEKEKRVEYRLYMNIENSADVTYIGDRDVAKQVRVNRGWCQTLNARSGEVIGFTATKDTAWGPFVVRIYMDGDLFMEKEDSGNVVTLELYGEVPE